jgi:hypothetical protein
MERGEGMAAGHYSTTIVEQCQKVVSRGVIAEFATGDLHPVSHSSYPWS